MTVIELIKKLLNVDDFNAEVEIAYKKGEFSDHQVEETLCAVRLEKRLYGNKIYLCERSRKDDFKALQE